ncbi:hypothetical protein [Streptomyces sp. NBC_00876]|uniref:hypothetical protein n=1 Tax=Streptomyces sp. NBC_00876 TaxID=2975853 RepID=UPI0038632164
MRRAHRLLAGLLTAGALLAATTGCAQSVDPIERLGRKAAQKVHPSPSAPEALPAAVRGEAPGAMAVVACGPRRAGYAGPQHPPARWWPDRPGPYPGMRAGAGCAHS